MQGKLADQDNIPIPVFHRFIHHPLRVIKYAKVHDLATQPLYILLPIGIFYPQ